MGNYKFKVMQYMFNDKAVKCNTECDYIPNSLICKLRIFSATCPTKSLKEDYRTGCYEVVDKEPSHNQ